MLVLMQSTQAGPIHLINHKTGDVIELSFLSATPHQIKWGFDAPDHIEILRDKVYQKRDL